jgi:hypothetical protein
MKRIQGGAGILAPLHLSLPRGTVDPHGIDLRAISPSVLAATAEKLSPLADFLPIAAATTPARGIAYGDLIAAEIRVVAQLDRCVEGIG